MGEVSFSGDGLHELNLASRKAEEAALRRFAATIWLESLVGSLGTSNQPSEKEFISCLRSGLVLCNAINRVQPGAVPKVVENHAHFNSFTREFQPLPAYQHFENVKNFLVAVQELNLPAFEASDLERDNLDAGSVAKVVDCILALKSYNEWKQLSGGNGIYKPVRSPIVLNLACKAPSRTLAACEVPDSRRRLNMSTAESPEHEDLQAKAITECMLNSKENIDGSLLASFRNGNLDSKKLSKIIAACCLEEQLKRNSREVLKPIANDCEREQTSLLAQSTASPERSLTTDNPGCCKTCLRKGSCEHRRLFQMQVNELSDLKTLLSRAKSDFQHLQFEFQNDLSQLGRQVEELSSAALGYQKVVKENRELYNLVQDLKGNIRVYCRIRPVFGAEAKNVVEYIGGDGSLVIFDPTKPLKDGRKVFQFNQVFGANAKQDDVFRETQPLVRSVMDGYNVCIFAYGQTGSGKTHTMCGPSSGTDKDMGINYLALSYLFEVSNERKDTVNYNIHVQMVEIYNEQVRDLLTEDSLTSKVEIRSCTGDDGLNLPDATLHLVKSASDVLNLMKLGEVNRAVSSTTMNNRSSRSHSILTIHVNGKDTTGNTLRSCLHLVDLAGSERVDKSEVTGDRLKEAQFINKSLSCLGDVITALAQKNSHIPYRNSKLTLLLQDSLGGHAKTLMIAHVSPEGGSFGETVSILKFAQRVSTVELGAARSNKESSEVKALKEQIEALKKELTNREGNSIKVNKLKESTIRTPQPRRLSIESNSERSATRARRFSLEGPKHGERDPLQLKSENTIQSMALDSLAVEKYGSHEVVEAVLRPSEQINTDDSMMPVYHQNNLQSPPTSARTSRVIRIDGAMNIHSVAPKTPEPSRIAKIDTQNSYSQTHRLISSNTTKGSQVRKSLRTIGKMINGSTKRVQQNPVESETPLNKASKISDGRSPSVASERPLRRQSLTGIQPERSRRSSLEGTPTNDSNTIDTRNARTPPPRASIKTTSRWM